MSPARPTVSVIVPSFRGGPQLRRCLEALMRQESAPRFEVIVVRSAVSAGGPSHADGHPLPQDDRLRVIDYGRRLPAAAARNIGVMHAAGGAFAFTDADAVPGVRWIHSLAGDSERMSLCVVGAIENGTPASAVGTAEYLTAFVDLHPRRPAATVWHGATCNLLVPRRLWERFGPFPEDMGGGEDTLLTATLHREGLLRFSSAASVTHINRTRLRDVVVHQYEYGRFTALLVRRGPYKHGWLIRHRALAPIAAAMRIVSIATRTVLWSGVRPAVAARAAPVVVLAVGAWTLGAVRTPRGVNSGGQTGTAAPRPPVRR